VEDNEDEGNGNSNGTSQNQNQYNPFDNARSGQTQMNVQVNTDTAKRALIMLQETQQMGENTLVELGMQAEQIDRVESMVENIHENMNKTDKLLRGIESLPAYIGNSIFRKKEPSPRVVGSKDRTITVIKGVAPPMEIEILCKKKDCSFQLGILSLGEDGFQFLDPNTKLLLSPEFNYKYSEISDIVLRTRPEHLDIRFNPPRQHKERFRLMSSYNQIIVNELYYRMNGTPKISFDPGSTVFQFATADISIQAPAPRKEVKNGFFIQSNNPGFKTSSLMGDDVSQSVKDDLDTVDNHINEMSSILSNVYDINVTMGREIDRQNEQIERVSGRVEDADQRVNNSNLRINKIIH